MRNGIRCDEYRICYVAFLDVLGFKNIVNEKTCKDILEIYKKIENRPFMQIMHKGEELIDSDSVQLKIMSDSICIYVEKTAKNALFALVETCALFQAHLAELQEPIFLRGAIVLGEIYASGDKTFGPGLTKAYLLEEKVAKFPRIIISIDLVEEGFGYMSESAAEILRRHLIVDPDYFMVIDFLSVLFGMDKAKKIEALKSYVGKKLSGTSQEAYDISIREKYLYLQEHIQDFELMVAGKKV